MNLLWASLVIDALAIGLTVFSVVMSNRANKLISKAIKDLHESHDELHDVVKRIG
jgi:hypothetical protein